MFAWLKNGKSDRALNAEAQWTPRKYALKPAEQVNRTTERFSVVNDDTVNIHLK
jgi:hypothetical protein